MEILVVTIFWQIVPCSCLEEDKSAHLLDNTKKAAYRSRQVKGYPLAVYLRIANVKYPPIFLAI